MVDRKETVWCVLCGARFTHAEVDGHQCCSKCGHEGVPCDTNLDLSVVINWHELRILGIWAENYARSCDAKDSSGHLVQTVQAIARRLQRQFPDETPLTLSEEIAELPRKMKTVGMQISNVDTNVPSPSLIPINGPGAIGSSYVGKKPQ